MQLRIKIQVILRGSAVNSWDLGGEIGRALSSLVVKVSSRARNKRAITCKIKSNINLEVCDGRMAICDAGHTKRRGNESYSPCGHRCSFFEDDGSHS